MLSHPWKEVHTSEMGPSVVIALPHIMIDLPLQIYFVPMFVIKGGFTVIF